MLHRWCMPQTGEAQRPGQDLGSYSSCCRGKPGGGPGLKQSEELGDVMDEESGRPGG